MITTADAKVASRLRRLRQHAMGVSDLARHSSSTVLTETYDEVGYNYRMTDLQAAVGLVQLERLDGMLARRRALAAQYSSGLSDLPWLTVPETPSGRLHNFQSYMVRLNDKAPMSRDTLMQKLLDRGVSSRRGIMAIHREDPYRSAQWESLLPITNLTTDSAVVLPLFHQMSDEDQLFVINALHEIGI